VVNRPTPGRSIVYLTTPTGGYMQDLKYALASEIKNHAASLVEKGLPTINNISIEYFHESETSLSCTLRIKQHNEYGPRYFVIKVSEMM
jgi:hypothetical protein